MRFVWSSNIDHNEQSVGRSFALHIWRLEIHLCHD